MRRCGHNPTDIEVSDIINKIHDDTGSLNFEVRLGLFFWFAFKLLILGFLQDHGGEDQRYRSGDRIQGGLHCVIVGAWSLVVVGMFQSFQ